MKRVIGYVRVSTDKQDLQRQKVLITKYCESMGYSLVRFIGEKVSGAKADRSGLAELLTISKKEADLIIVSELSRISRQDDIMTVISEIDSIRKNGLDLYILDTDTAINAADNIGGLEVIQLVFKAVGNADERKKIASRMKTGRYTKLVKNHYAFIGGRVPFGFDAIANPLYNEKSANDKEPKTILQPNSEQIEILKLMYTKIVNGYTLHRLAKYIIDNNISVFNSKDFASYQALIYKLLFNPLYIGKRTYNGEIFEIDPVISVDLFNQAKKALNNNRWEISSSEKNFNPLKGLLYCSCGRSMYLTTCKGYDYYKCGKKKDDADNIICSNKGVKSGTAFKAVWVASKSLLYQEEFNIKTTEKEQILLNDMNIVKAALVQLKDELTAKEKESKDTINKIENLTNLNLINVFEKKYNETESAISVLKERIIKKEKEYTKIADKYNETTQFSKDAKLEGLDLEAKSELLHKIIDKIVWYSDTLRKGFLDITYKNGFKEVIMIQTDKAHPLIMQLPSEFKMNPETRKVGIERKQPSNINKPFNFETKYEEFGFNELIKNFGEVEEWVITRMGQPIKLTHYFLCNSW